MPINSPTGFLDITNATLRTSNLEAENLLINGGNIYVTSELEIDATVLNLENVTRKGNVSSNTIEITNATTGLVATGNIHALKFIGDGSQLSGITSSGGGSSNLHQVIENGNVTSNTVQFTNATTGIVATGNVEAAKFIGSGSHLTGIPPTAITGTLSQWSDGANNDVYIASNVGIGNVHTLTSNTLQVGGNLYVRDTDANVLTVNGNVVASYFEGDGSKLSGIVTDLQGVTDNGNVTSNTVQFTNPTTGIVTTSNIQVGGTLNINTISAAAYHSLQAVTNLGNVTSNTVQFSNAITSLTADSNVVVTGNVTAGSFLGDGSELTTLNATTITSGTLDSARIPTLNQSTTGSAATLTTPRSIGGVDFNGSSSITPTTFGGATFSGDVAFDTNTLFVDASTNRVGLGTITPNSNLDVIGLATVSNCVTIGATKTFVVTVSGNYFIDGVERALLELQRGQTYIFDMSDGSNTGHPLAFSTAFTGSSSSYTTGVVSNHSTVASGSAGSKVTFSVPLDAPSSIYYYCTQHGSGMGSTGTASSISAAVELVVTGRVVATGNVTAGSFLGDGSELTALNAANIGSGTLDVARVPNLDAAKITTGTLDAARVPTPTTFTTATFSGDVTVDTDTFHVDTTNNRVGVGTISPNATLDVNGSTRSGYDTDTTSYFGRSAVGYCGHANYMSVAHIDCNDGGAYALLQESNGQTMLNSASGQSVHIRQGNTDKLVINSNGNVGIGTTTPHAKLQVNGQEGSVTSGSMSFLNTWGGSSPSSLTGISIYASHDIVGGSYIASHRGGITASDERIKKDIIDAEDGPALETLRLLKPKRYKYKDVVRGGTDPVWGFIAQEVRETLSYATQLRQDSIPNIYEMVNISTDSSVITFTNFDTSTLESGTKVLKVFDENDAEHFITFTEVIDDKSLRIEEDLSKWTQLFVYGQRVDDFVFVQKDAIWTVATAALQEVDRQLQAEKEKVTTLETQLASVLTRLDALENA